VTRPTKAYTDEERDILLRAARGHWAGGAVRWMLTTGCSRAEVCALTWAGIAGIDRHHPLHDEIKARRGRAVAEARATGRVLDRQPVFPGFYGQRLKSDAFRNTLRLLLHNQRRKEESARHRREAEDRPHAKVHA